MLFASRILTVISLTLLFAAPALASGDCRLQGLAQLVNDGDLANAEVAVPEPWKSEIETAWRGQHFYASQEVNVAYYPNRGAWPGTRERTGRRRAYRANRNANLAMRGRSDDHVAALLELGAKEVEIDHVRMVTQPEAATFFAKANARVDGWVREGVLTEDQTIRAALTFYPKSVDFWDFHSDPDLKGLLLVRPGIDPWPDPEKFGFVYNLPQIKHYRWQNAMAEGFMPLTLQGFYDHDLGHLTELLTDPALMRETREYYRQANSRPFSWSRNLDDIFRVPDDPLSDPVPEPKRRHFERIFVLSEFNSVPRIAQEEAIRAMMPEIFDQVKPESAKQIAEWMKRLDPETRRRHIRRILDSYEPLLARQGGGQRDSYNVLRAIGDPEFFVPLREAIKKNGKWPTIPLQEFRATSAVRESLHGLAEEMKFLYDKAYGAVPRKSPIFGKLLVDVASRFQMGMYQGVKLRITPAQLIRDITPKFISPESKAYRFYESFARPDGFLWNAFVSDAAQGKGTRTLPTFLNEVEDLNDALRLDKADLIRPTPDP